MTTRAKKRVTKFGPAFDRHLESVAASRPDHPFVPCRLGSMGGCGAPPGGCHHGVSEHMVCGLPASAHPPADQETSRCAKCGIVMDGNWSDCIGCGGNGLPHKPRKPPADQGEREARNTEAEPFSPASHRGPEAPRGAVVVGANAGSSIAPEPPAGEGEARPCEWSPVNDQLDSHCVIHGGDMLKCDKALASEREGLERERAAHQEEDKLIASLAKSLRYWMPDEETVRTKHLAAFNESLAALQQADKVTKGRRTESKGFNRTD